MVSLISTDSNSLLISAVLMKGLTENSADYISQVPEDISVHLGRKLQFLWLRRYRAHH